MLVTGAAMCISGVSVCTDTKHADGILLGSIGIGLIAGGFDPIGRICGAPEYGNKEEEQ